MQATPSYQKRTVCFVDILGFADLVEHADKDPNLRGKIIEALSKVRALASPQGGDTDLRAQNFSDSLILSATDDAEGFWHLLLSVDALTWNLLQMGVLVRGGITIGGMLHTEHLVFGVGVNEAYRMESMVAKVPRVALSKTAVQAAEGFAIGGEIWNTYKNSRLLRDKDGVWFLNYLNDLRAFNSQSGTSTTHPMHMIGNWIRNHIQTMVDTTLDRPDVYSKLEWLGRYWNYEIAEPGKNNTSALGYIQLAGQEPRATPIPFRTV